MNPIAADLEGALQKAGITKAAFAEACNVTIFDLSRWLSGSFTPHSKLKDNLSLYKNAAELMGKSTEELLTQFLGLKKIAPNAVSPEFWKGFNSKRDKRKKSEPASDLIQRMDTIAHNLSECEEYIDVLEDSLKVYVTKIRGFDWITGSSDKKAIAARKIVTQKDREWSALMDRK